MWELLSLTTVMARETKHRAEPRNYNYAKINKRSIIIINNARMSKTVWRLALL